MLPFFRAEIFGELTLSASGKVLLDMLPVSTFCLAVIAFISPSTVGEKNSFLLPLILMFVACFMSLIESKRVVNGQLKNELTERIH